jgi:lipopolysaccharide export system protein LptC
MKTKNLLIILGFILLLVSGWFYWFQYRPSRVRTNCTEEANEKARKLLKTLIDKPGYYERGMSQQELEEMYDAGLHFNIDYDSYYKNCLNEHGLK